MGTGGGGGVHLHACNIGKIGKETVVWNVSDCLRICVQIEVTYTVSNPLFFNPCTSHVVFFIHTNNTSITSIRAMRGVTVSMSAFLACHQCYYCVAHDLHMTAP